MITTAQQHIIRQQESYFPDAGGTFSMLLSGITLATKMIQAKVRQVGLLDRQKLDVYANQALLQCLGLRDNVALLVSEEDEEPVTFDRAETGKYLVVFDPLDGSSNIDVNVSVGTIFSIFRRLPVEENSLSSVLQPGVKQVAAGYVIYGSSTILVYTAGQGVFGFTLDPAIGAYVLSHDGMRMPEQGRYYSVNEANADSFPEVYREYLARLRRGEIGQPYSSRYIGTLVADFHRTLLTGGVFLYPPTVSHPRGKLRLLYEANPIAFIAEQAGGFATNGRDRILDIQPENIHQRTAFVVGSRVEMEAFARCSGG